MILFFLLKQIKWGIRSIQEAESAQVASGMNVIYSIASRHARHEIISCVCMDVRVLWMGFIQPLLCQKNFLTLSR